MEIECERGEMMMEEGAGAGVLGEVLIIVRPRLSVWVREREMEERLRGEKREEEEMERDGEEKERKNVWEREVGGGVEMERRWRRERRKWMRKRETKRWERGR